MNDRRVAAFTCLLLVAHVAGAEVRVQAQQSGTQSRLRGIVAVDANVAWASGRDGTVVRTVDGGAHWQARNVPDAHALDFRDIAATDADTAVVLGIGPGDASRVYRTDDGGLHWVVTLRNDDPRVFFDCMAFDGEHGWMLGDPVDGRFQLRTTDDGGRHWTLQPDGPPAEPGEAAFAASGTCIARQAGLTLVATGGQRSRVLWRRDGERDWHSQDSGMARGIDSAGMFSIASRVTVGDVVGVGGDHAQQAARGNAATFSVRSSDAASKASSDDAGSHTSPRTLTAPRGYRSGVACIETPPTCIAVGPTGIDRLVGDVWMPISDSSFDAVSMSGSVGWTSGEGGRISRIAVKH